MKYILIILSLMLSGCFGAYSFKPVSSMSDYQLRNEYLDIQSKLRTKDIQSSWGLGRTRPRQPTSYTTTGSAYTSGNTSGRTYGNTYSGNYSGTTTYNARTTPNYGGRDAAAGRATGIILRRLAGASAVSDINKLESRLTTLRWELSRRGLNP